MPSRRQMPNSDTDQVLYVYRCGACGHSGEQHRPGDSHDGGETTCAACSAPVTLEWDGGVTLVARNRENP